MLRKFEDEYLQGPLRDCHFYLAESVRSDEVDIVVCSADFQMATEALVSVGKGIIPHLH